MLHFHSQTVKMDLNVLCEFMGIKLGIEDIKLYYEEIAIHLKLE